MTEITTPLLSTRELRLEAGAEVEVTVTSANVRVTGTDRDTLTIRTRDGEAIDDELAIEATPAGVRIRELPGGGYRIGHVHIRPRGPADLDIDVPRSARLSLRTMSGDVEAEGVGGESQWKSASGDLRLAVVAGPVAIESMSGDVTLLATAGVEARARSVSGDLVLRAPRFDGLAASTTSGDIRIVAELAEGPEHAISSVSGDVELTTPSEVRVTTQSITGDVHGYGATRSEGGSGHRTLVIGNGAVAVSIRTTSGDVRVRSDAAAGPPAAPIAPEPPVAPRPPALPAAPVAPRPPEPPIVVVAEAEAAPNLVRTDTVDDLAPDVDGKPDAADAADAVLGVAGPTDRRESARLEILRALERGDLDIESASHRLEILEEAGPRYFRGWC